MAYYELHDIKRDRIPYLTDYSSGWNRPVWAPQIYNTPLLNLKKTGMCAIIASCLVEPVNHFRSAYNSLNYVYESPRNTLQASVFIKEVFKTPFFWSELRKKLVYGAVQHTLDAGFKIAVFHYTFGATWSPKTFADCNSLKYLFFGFWSAFLGAWSHYPLLTARKAYYADQTWPAELRKGYRSPLHALLTIPFKEGPLYLFRGGAPHFVGNWLGMGWTYYTFTWFKDKFFFVWKFNDVSYSYCKFWILNFAFAIGAIGSQPFYTIKEIMDKAPRERGGKPVFNTTYEAIRYVKLRWDEFQPNLQHGYAQWFKNYGIVLYITIWLADDLGLMDNYRVDPYSWKVSNGYYSD